MRRNVSAEMLREFMRELGNAARSRGAVYFTGGATALLFGLRETTIDVDIRLDPEPAGIFEALPGLKNRFDINVELASPADFIPVAKDWKERSIFIAEHGMVSFFHYDLAAQALSKVERGFVQDIEDARAFLQKGEISPENLLEYFKSIVPALVRYPALEPERFEHKLKSFLENEC